MEFCLHAWRFEFKALDAICFPAHTPSNVLRGALGSMLRRVACLPECDSTANKHRGDCIYAHIFESHAQDGPSGLHDPPRPFVFRAAHLDRTLVRPAETFRFDMHVFDIRRPVLPYLIRAFSELANEGVGSGRGRAVLTRVLGLNDDGRGATLYDGAEVLRIAEPIKLPLSPAEQEIRALRIRFLTPTELKSTKSVAAHPDFAVLLARARDRISMLRRLYGEGPLEMDFRGMTERASAVQMTRVEVERTEASRRSSRTGQTHPLGGFVGFAEYEGRLSEFVPLLRVAQYTGVGRQTVWGKGAIRVEIIR